MKKIKRKTITEGIYRLKLKVNLKNTRELGNLLSRLVNADSYKLRTQRFNKEGDPIKERYNYHLKCNGNTNIRIDAYKKNKNSFLLHVIDGESIFIERIPQYLVKKYILRKSPQVSQNFLLGKFE